MTGVRNNKGKAPVNLILSQALIEVAKVAEFGAKKYEPHNYRKGMRWSFFIDSGMRHLIKRCRGFIYDLDPECPGCQSKKCEDHSGLFHTAHIAWNFLALLEFEVEKVGNDDLFSGYESKDHSENAPGS
jgi:hypothetical protein